MHLVVLLVVVLGLVFGPQWWARRVLERHGRARTDLPGTGGELARHLASRGGLAVTVEKLDGEGDHYDPREKAVRLSPAVYDGRSLTAVVVAAHEIGHAIQHHIGYAPLSLRTRLVTMAALAERLGSVLLIGLPFVAVLTRVPAAGVLMLLAGVAVLLVPVLVHLVTLPVEFDASFNRALPILSLGYLGADDLPAARQILFACALTYVAASLMTLLNFWRWIQILRR